LSRYFLLSKIHVYSKNKQPSIEIKYPSIIVSNHVSPLDVTVLAYLSRFVETTTEYTVPAREDILKPNFLVKEFKPKGGLKFLLKFLDFANIVPFLLNFVSAIPVKRPFRDDARQLLKTGELRRHIDQNWEVITKGILFGKNLFMFPEGTYTDDGYVNSLRRGINLVREKIKGLYLNHVCLSYDYLSFSKPDVHATLGNLEPLATNLNDEELSKYIRDSIAKDMVLHHGNLLSLICFSNEFKTGISQKIFFDKLKSYLEVLKSKSFLLSKRFFQKNSFQIFQELVNKFIKQKYLSLENLQLSISKNILVKPNERAEKFLKANPILYHKNQLRFHEKQLLEIWDSL